MNPTRSEPLRALCNVVPSSEPAGVPSSHLQWYRCLVCTRHFTEATPTVNPSVCFAQKAARS